MSRARRSRIPFAVLGNNQVVDHGTDDITLEVYPPTEVIFSSAPGDDLCHVCQYQSNAIMYWDL